MLLSWSPPRGISSHTRAVSGSPAVLAAAAVKEVMGKIAAFGQSLGGMTAAGRVVGPCDPLQLIPSVPHACAVIPEIAHWPRSTFGGANGKRTGA